MIKDSWPDKPLEAHEHEPLIASTSNTGVIPPPPFTYNFSASLVDDLPPTSGLDALLDDLEPPPEFSPYHAECFEVGNGDVVSHDSHLNTDGAYTCYISSNL